MNFKNQIITDDPGMCNNKTYYEIEDLYQAFKERYQKEIKLKGTKIETLGECHIGEETLEYYKKKLYKALGIPKNNIKEIE